MDWGEYRNRILTEVDYDATFNRLLTNVNRNGEELKASCPFAKTRHESATDSTPSFTVNLEKGVYGCHTCGSRGNIHTMIKDLFDLSNEEAWFKLGDQLRIDRPASSKPVRPEISFERVYGWHRDLMEFEETHPLRKRVLLEKRGLNANTLTEFMIGWDGDRITIPIFDELGNIVNVRKYRHQADNSEPKVINYTDEKKNTYGTPVRVFNIARLLDKSVDTIVWTEGETDAMVAEQNGFPAACPTGGAGAFAPGWIQHFKRKKRVYIVQDNDLAGRTAAENIAKKLVSQCEVYIVSFGEEAGRKFDVTDFFGTAGNTPADFQVLLDSAERYFTVDDGDTLADDFDAELVHLAESSKAEYYGKRIQVPTIISSKSSTPYIVPTRITACCGDAAGQTNKCVGCPLSERAGQFTKSLSSKDKDLLKFINVTDKQKHHAMEELFRVPTKCPFYEFNVDNYSNVEQVMMIPKAETAHDFSAVKEYAIRNGYMVGEAIQTNRSYTLVGYTHTHPETQEATYLFDKAFADKDLAECFEMTPEIYEDLKIFQPDKDQTIDEKMFEIHNDLEKNVTSVWERKDVAIGVDLIYHTALSFYYQGDFIKRGWAELLIVGDSGQAKTTIVERMLTHYKAGAIYSGESSSRTGLVYTIVPNANKQWTVVWGAFPLNDRELVVVDELSGIDPKDIADMSDVRTSGVAKVNRVVTAETTARTRAIYISNPRDGRKLNSNQFGCQSLIKLIGKTEDIRRFDLAMGVAAGDVDPELINRNKNNIKKVEHRYTSDICNLRVMWAWSRKPKDIVFKPDAENAIYKYAKELSKKYSSDIPIVSDGDQRLKLARLAVSCAACVFSTDEDGIKVIVKAEHVEYVVKYMSRIFASKGFAYDKFSELQHKQNDTSESKMETLLMKYSAIDIGSTELVELVEQLAKHTYFRRDMIQDITAAQPHQVSSIMKFLTTNNLLQKVKNDYRKLPLMTEFLEFFVESNVTETHITKLKSKMRKGIGGLEY